MKWQWFLGGKKMFWVSVILFILLVVGFVITYIIDPISSMVVEEVTELDTKSIKTASEQYVSKLGITLSKPVMYRFVKFNPSKDEHVVVLGTFHVWNNKYYIDISDKVTSESDKFIATVEHETRHMIVAELQIQKVIDLMEYTEEIAQEKNTYYNDLFNSGVYLLKNKQKGGK